MQLYKSNDNRIYPSASICNRSKFSWKWMSLVMWGYQEDHGLGSIGATRRCFPRWLSLAFDLLFILQNVTAVTVVVGLIIRGNLGSVLCSGERRACYKRPVMGKGTQGSKSSWTTSAYNEISRETAFTDLYIKGIGKKREGKYSFKVYFSFDYVYAACLCAHDLYAHGEKMKVLRSLGTGVIGSWLQTTHHGCWEHNSGFLGE